MAGSAEAGDATGGTTLLGRAELLELDRALAIEWQARNDLGAYAAASSLGTSTRLQHGLLVVAPAVGSPRVLLENVDEEIELDDGEGGERVPLSTHEYHDGTIQPAGYLRLEEVHVGGDRPYWRWRIRDVEIDKTLAMVPRSDSVAIRYRVLSSRSALRLRVTPFTTNRAIDESTRGALDWRFLTEPRPGGCVVRAWSEAAPLGIFGWTCTAENCSPARFIETGLWYWRFLRRADRAEGREHIEDLLAPGLLVFELGEGDAAWLLASADPAVIADPDSPTLRRALAGALPDGLPSS